MAKKKTAVKTPVLKAPILRQALSAVKTAIIHFSDDHILSIGYNPTSKATVMTDIPQNLTSQFTLGEGGGGSSLYTCSINLVNSSGGRVEGSIYTVGDNGLELTNISLLDGETDEKNFLVFYEPNEELYFISFMLYATYTVSDTVNCTYDEDESVLIITDISLPSSCTVTFITE